VPNLFPHNDNISNKREFENIDLRFVKKTEIANLATYANNAAAVAGGLVAGQIYRTNADPDTICVVH